MTNKEAKEKWYKVYCEENMKKYKEKSLTKENSELKSEPRLDVMTRKELIQSIIDYCFDGAECGEEVSLCWQFLIEDAGEQLVKEIRKHSN